MMATPQQLRASEYKLGRAALSNLLKQKNTTWWLTWGRACLAAQVEAMEISGSNSTIGRGYNQAYERIVRREAPVPRHEQRPLVPRFEHRQGCPHDGRELGGRAPQGLRPLDPGLAC